ncbi:MAG TPA: hypothetical protein VHD33_00035 [Legionellaceae bacterium]|nr:hypothetical protein [Legionellaceae bacterium]
MKKYYIKVTQEDIDKGCFGSPKYCPVARAIVRRFQLKNYPCVGSGEAMYWTEQGTERRFILPAPARAFIFEFDHQLEAKPFSFKLIAK